MTCTPRGTTGAGSRGCSPLVRCARPSPAPPGATHDAPAARPARQRQRPRGLGAALGDAARRAARRAWHGRCPLRLRRGGLRHVHGAARRRAGERLPGPCCTGGGPPDHHAARADGHRRRPAPAAGVLPAPRCLSVRLLHARRDADRARPRPAARQAEQGRDQVRARRQPVPVHGLYQDPRCRRGVREPRRERRAAAGAAVSTAGLPPASTQQVIDTAAGGYRVVGRSSAHHDFIEKVKGSLHYAADWRLPGMLHGRVVRSQLPSARITGVDVSAARALPGVAAVLTAADVPDNRVVEVASGGLAEFEVNMPVLAEDRVRYAGEPIALVAAATQQIAQQAAELVVVDYEELPGVFDVDAARADGAPAVHDVGNTLVTWQIRCGDVARALAAADVVVEGEYRTQHVEHAYLEPEAGVGWVDNGVVTLRVSTQVIEHAATIADILRVPQNKVRVIAAYLGGGFGGKEDMTAEPYLALLVWHTRRPVRMICDRQESLAASTKRHPFIMRYRTGATSYGTITAQEVEILGDAGAYPNLSPRVLFAAAACACGPYRAPNASIAASAVFTNNVPSSAFRGFGAMQVVLGHEAQMDLLAERVGSSRAEVRERNFLAKGDMLPTGERLDTHVAVGEAMQRATALLGEPPRPSGPGKLVGRGIGCNRHPYGRAIWFRDHASAWLSLQGDGTLLIRSGVTDLGAGQAASLCQIAGEVLGVPLDDIGIHIGDSALNPPAGGTFATRQLYMSGNAVLQAARELRERIAPVAAHLLGAAEDDLDWAGGRVRTHRSDLSISLAELATACDKRSVSTAHLSTWRAQAGSFDPSTGQGDTFPDYTYGTHAADVEVDTETGQVTVLRYAACHDVGRAINPMRVQGQIQGGAMQGLGYALTEDMAIEDGYVQAILFANYLIPNARDFPDVLVDIVESGEGKGPLGARGIGEPPIGNVAATIASAIQDAIGVRPDRLPMTPERILDLLDKRRQT